MSCNYNLTSLRDEVYLIDMELETVTRYQAYNIELEDESGLLNRYTFDKSISFTLNGYVPTLSTRGMKVGFVSKSGDAFIINPEHDGSISYKFTLSSEQVNTTYSISFNENLDIESWTVGEFEDAEESDCSYSTVGKPVLSVAKFHESLLDEYNASFLTLSGLPLTALDGVVTLEESYDGIYYDQTVSCIMPLTEGDQAMNDALKQFMQNKYRAVVEHAGIYYIAGDEYGLEVNSTIASAEESSTITLTFRIAQNVPLFTSDSLSYGDTDNIMYFPVRFSERGQKGYACTGDGEAMYILRRGFYADGTPTNRYQVADGYQNQFPGLRIVDIYRPAYPFDCIECIIPDELIVNLPSQLSFSGSGQTVTFTVQSENSSWSATSVPSFITLTSTSGGSGSTSVTATCNSNTDDFGLLKFSNDKHTSDVSLQVTIPLFYATPSTIDAHAQDVYVYANSNGFTFDHAEVRVGMLGTNLNVVVTQMKNDKWRVTIPKNPNSSSNRVIVLFFTRGQETQTVDITQNQLFVGWRTLYEVCANGELQAVEEKFESYDGSTWQTTGELRRVTIGTC